MTSEPTAPEASDDDRMRRTPLPEDSVINAIEAGAPQIYFNDFTNIITPSDMIVILERNTKPVAVLNMSYTVAKSVALALGHLVTRFEEMANRSMLTIGDVSKALDAAAEKDGTQ